MIIHINEIQHSIGSFMWVFSRIISFVSLTPLLGTKYVIRPIKLTLSMVVSFVIVSNYQIIVPYVDIFSFESFMIILQQIIIGVVFGLVLQTVFHVFVMLGQIISMQYGLGFAVMNDPTSNSSIPIVGQFYLLLITVLFIGMNGHLILLKFIIESFKTIPISSNYTSFIDTQYVISLGGWLFEQSFKMSLPAVTSLLLVNMTLGIMTKAAPQMNIFAIGFGITMIVGVLLMYLDLESIKYHFFDALEKSTDTIENTFNRD